MMGEKQADIYVEVREMEREDGADVSRRACPEAGEEPLRLLLLVEPIAVHLKLGDPPLPCDDVALLAAGSRRNH
jgi:hypothetical protein